MKFYQILQILNDVNGQILEEEESNYQEEFLPLIDRPSSNTRSATALKLFLESSLKLDEREFINEDLEYMLDDNDNDDVSVEENSAEENSEEKELDNMDEGAGVFDWDSNY